MHCLIFNKTSEFTFTPPKWCLYFLIKGYVSISIFYHSTNSKCVWPYAKDLGNHCLQGVGHFRKC